MITKLSFVLAALTAALALPATPRPWDTIKYLTPRRKSVKTLIAVAALLLICIASNDAIADGCAQLDIMRGHFKFLNPLHVKNKAVLVNIKTNLQAYAGITEQHTVLLNWVDTRDAKLITAAEINSSGVVTMTTVDETSIECLAKAQLRFFRADRNVWALVSDQTIISLWQGPFPAHWLEDLPIVKKP
jgi:hypothetical protein